MTNSLDKPSSNALTIAIIGGGFSGTLTAINLLSKKVCHPLKVVLIERAERIAKGVAYGTMCPLHLLNVPAKDMTALPDEPQHFFKWAKAQDPSVTEATFVPRMRYGAYLEATLNDTLSHMPSTMEFKRVQGEVKEIDITDGGKRAKITLANNESLAADRVVLAVGNLAPANVHIKDASFYESSRYIRNPWSKNSLAQLEPNSPILLIGTGLTMIDKALELKLMGHKGHIYALSRHGFLPNIHIPGITRLPVPFDPKALPTTVRQVVKLLRKLAKDVEAANEANWRQVADSIRPVTQEIWKLWNDTEKKRFIRHIRCFWDVHRHRIAPEVGQMIDGMIKGGQLTIMAARLISIEDNGTEAIVTFRHRGKCTDEELKVSRVINCTGADSNVKTIDDPLIADLRKKGLLVSDRFGLGPKLTDTWSLIDDKDKSSEVIYAVGPLLKGVLWESIAVPELRVQAAQLAEYLTKSKEPVLSH